jgi:hypothetical protein
VGAITAAPAALSSGPSGGAGLGDGISFHGFRHGFASMLIVELRLDPVNVARQLGHADPAITLRTYSHEFAKARDADNTRAELAARFGGLLASSRHLAFTSPFSSGDGSPGASRK